VSRCEGFLTFQELTPSPSSGCAGGLVAPKLSMLKFTEDSKNLSKSIGNVTTHISQVQQGFSITL